MDDMASSPSCDNPSSAKQKWSLTKHRSLSLTKLMSTVAIRLESDKPSSHGQQRNRGLMDRVFSLNPTPSVVLDPAFRIVEVSRSYLEFFHLAREECIDARITDLDPSKIPTNDAATLQDAINQAIALKKANTVDAMQISDDSYYSRLRIVPIFENGSLIYILLEGSDVIKKQIEGEVVKEQLNAPNTYRSLVDSVRGIAIFMLDANGYVATWNDGSRILKGYEAEEIIGKHFSILFSEEDYLRGKPGKELAKCLQEGRVEDEGWRRRKDGTTFWANVVIAPIYHSGTHIGFSKVTRDITERKATEARLISAYEEASRLKSEFLANMSHEIRTPMNGLCSALALLRDTKLSEEQNSYTKIIMDTSDILLQIMNDILDYSKISSGSFSINTDVIPIREGFDACVRHCQTVVKPEVKIQTNFAPEIPDRLKGDPLRYRQILQNLIGNAAKFTEQGTITINVTMPDQDETSHCIHTEVIDTGIGVSVELGKVLFEPFTQLFEPGGKQYQGTGLGLAICKRLVEMMEGKLGYYPNPDGPGSVFWFTLNFQKMEIPCGLQRESTPEGRLTPLEEIKCISASKQLLLVEDNKINQAVMLKVLNALGFRRIDAACDGQQAVSILKQTPFSYDAVLMDINMPVMDGVAATVEIRDTLNLDVPIIAMTANALKGDAESFLSKGMNGYVPKPVDRGRLIEVLLSVLK
ncbi:hypothetical protein AJ80_05444 [Polytolypa hystricis UAMH7299]|uniref:Two-component system protein A n=1 Tax=Polytolypa hystricis (strain UAMH7299) TaxID=1447883 RepID=A0A2B7Y2M9_POLH7|nr:hypothetical protein AJ80_05444 [Polytolypa hystricis UAMH7299]